MGHLVDYHAEDKKLMVLATARWIEPSNPCQNYIKLDRHVFIKKKIKFLYSAHQILSFLEDFKKYS